jgi:hypothetical protein
MNANLCFKLGKPPVGTYEMLQTICGHETLSRSIIFEWFKPVFLNRRTATRYRTLASIISGPRLIEKRIYRAALWQRLRTTDLNGLKTVVRIFRMIQEAGVLQPIEMQTQ